VSIFSGGMVTGERASGLEIVANATVTSVLHIRVQENVILKRKYVRGQEIIKLRIVQIPISKHIHLNYCFRNPLLSLNHPKILYFRLLLLQEALQEAVGDGIVDEGIRLRFFYVRLKDRVSCLPQG
jgi:hypothetical protein